MYLEPLALSLEPVLYCPVSWRAAISPTWWAARRMVVQTCVWALPS